MSLIEDIQAVDKKKLFVSDDNFVMYPTGILQLDYANGFWQTVMGPDGTLIKIPAIGIKGGSIIGIIATTGGGKSTFACQMGYNIIKNFKHGLLIFVDAEKTMFKERMLQLTGAPVGDKRVVLNSKHTDIESVLNQIHQIADFKESGGDKYMYTVEGRSFDGKPFKVYEPTIMIIDSLPYFNSSGYNVDDLGTNTDQARAAKDVTRFFTNVNDICTKYNITIIVINHIRPKIEMDRYSPPPKGLIMLGQGETLPRGLVAQYAASTYFRINNRKSDAYTLADDGFDGAKSQFQLAKSKSNSTGVTFPVTFTNASGYDPIYSIYEFAHHMGVIEGRNPYLYFKGLDTLKFNRKDFKMKMTVDTVFREAVLTVLKPYYESLLSSDEETWLKDKEGNVEDVTILEYGAITL